MKWPKPSRFIYRLARIASWFVATFIFRRKILRNEIKRKKGPFVVIANHQAVLDFVSLIGCSSTPMHFVVSDSFFNTLPVKWAMRKMAVIPKQQFQTNLTDIRRMRSVLDQGRPLVIYPAGLMSEDGLSTPIPNATYQFLKWTRADIYVARSTGTYFAMPKWSKRIRPGRTYLDIYKLFSKEELPTLDLDTIREKTDQALLFDAYRDQEKLQIKYKNGDDIEGLENVLYQCPECHREHVMAVKDRNVIYCTECGFQMRCDEYGMLHGDKELRYVSDWSRMIYNDLQQKILQGTEGSLFDKTEVYMINEEEQRYLPVGQGTLALNAQGFFLYADIHGEYKELEIPICTFASLPFSPGNYLEIQHGKSIYRCHLKNGKHVMKYINMVKIFYQLSLKNRVECPKQAQKSS